MSPPKLLKAAEAAPLLRLTAWQVTRLCRAGTIRASRPGKQWLIAEEDLQAYLETGANRQEAAS